MSSETLVLPIDVITRRDSFRLFSWLRAGPILSSRLMWQVAWIFGQEFIDLVTLPFLICHPKVESKQKLEDKQFYVQYGIMTGIFSKQESTEIFNRLSLSEQLALDTTDYIWVQLLGIKMNMIKIQSFLLVKEVFQMIGTEICLENSMFTIGLDRSFL